jgi:hypothetical protein
MRHSCRAVNIPNSGTLQWTVPVDTPLASEYVLQIQDNLGFVDYSPFITILTIVPIPTSSFTSTRSATPRKRSSVSIILKSSTSSSPLPFTTTTTALTFTLPTPTSASRSTSPNPQPSTKLPTSVNISIFNTSTSVPTSAASGLSGGAKAGIAVGSVVGGFALLFILSFLALLWRKRKSQPSPAARDLNQTLPGISDPVQLPGHHKLTRLPLSSHPIVAAEGRQTPNIPAHDSVRTRYSQMPSDFGPSTSGINFNPSIVPPN